MRPALGLAPGAIPGVYHNARGEATDAFGVLLSFKDLHLKHVAHEVAIIGKEAETPAEVLKVAALDRRLPLSTRVDAAKAAAPYYDRKKPVSVDGGADPDNPEGPGLPLALKHLSGLDDTELAQLESLLTRAHAAPGAPSGGAG